MNFGVNFCVNFLRGFFHGFWTVDFGVDFCVNFLRGFVGWDSSPVDFTVDLSVEFFFHALRGFFIQGAIMARFGGRGFRCGFPSWIFLHTNNQVL